MEDKNLPAVRQKTFEELKQVNQYGAEYWNARDLQPLLGYNQWRSFDNAIIKAIVSCEQSGNTPEYHFARARKPIVGGKGAVQEVVDYHLSRFACYLTCHSSCLSSLGANSKIVCIRSLVINTRLYARAWAANHKSFS